MKKTNNNQKLIEESNDELFITDNSEIITRKYRLYKVIVVVSKTELLSAIEKIWEQRWVGKHDIVKLTILKNRVNVSSSNFNCGIKPIHKTITINSAFISNPSGKNITLFVKNHILKEALSLIIDDKIIIRAGSDFTGSNYIAIKSHDLYEKTIVIIKQTTLP
jgi:hypothetical protein